MVLDNERLVRGHIEMKGFGIAVAQMDLKLGDKESNLRRAGEMASVASKQEVNFVCFPEYLPTGSPHEECSRFAEPIPGYTVDKLGAIADENGTYLVASLLEMVDGKVYNTAVLLGPDGKLLTKYRKMHLFMDEQDYMAHGTEFALADTKFGRVGIIICYDAIFPEVARKLATQGAEIVFMPANWPVPFMSQWRLATGARALDNQIWLVATNRIGADSKFSYFGRSRIVNPYGDPVVECGEGEELMTAIVDMELAKEFRKQVDFLRDRQPKVYG